MQRASDLHFFKLKNSTKGIKGTKSPLPFARTSAMQKRAFAVVGPSIWNGLPLSIRSLPRNLSQTFLSQLKAVLFGRVGVGSASE